MLQGTFEKKSFQFKRPSGTSRGILTQKHAWFVTLWDSENPTVKGLGECSIIPGLSPDFVDFESYENQLKLSLDQVIEHNSLDQNLAFSTPFPSIVFGVESALLDLKNGGKALFFDTDFTRGLKSIPINGLIWMGSKAFMEEQIEEKLRAGYSCLKLKIGALDFEQELEILTQLRQNFTAEQLIIRVDANGAFQPKEALQKLDRLSGLDLHSIEQPIQAGNWEAMAELCAQTKLPIALDEELIGIYAPEEKLRLLQTIQPQFIILKPSLHGGFSGCREWIELAEQNNIPWWMTSALESNVGLNAIAQFTSTFVNPLHQGLGTGSLYVENTPTKLSIQNGFLFRGNS